MVFHQELTCLYISNTRIIQMIKLKKLSFPSIEISKSLPYLIQSLVGQIQV